MDSKRTLHLFHLTSLFFFILLLISCKDKPKNEQDAAMVNSPEEMNKKVSELIRGAIDGGSFDYAITIDSIKFSIPLQVKFIYQQYTYAPLWSDKQQWLPMGDSLYTLIESAKLYGLFPEDYHLAKLTNIRSRFIADSAVKNDRRDAMLWFEADVLLTDAFTKIVHDVKLGRLPNDSITLRKDSILSDEFYAQQLAAVTQSGTMTKVINSLEPQQLGYQLLKKGIKKFLAQADNQEFTFVPAPSGGAVEFRKAIQKRLFEGNYISFDSVKADSAQLAIAIKKFQKEKGLAIDGVAGEATLRVMNTTDHEKFIRIAISMDKYKMLPEKMPAKYVWVNIPAYKLDVVENDTVKFSSKVICGKPKTSTPLLNSAISTLITYPQWVPPPSIIRKEILPAVKRNPGYLAKKGFSLLNSKGEEVDPYSVDWSKYSKGIPYRVVQGSGDANSLGIMKFYFDNKYSVYLHDTNQRYLFDLSMRSLSHGCVRVQDWEKLAYYILENDNVSQKNNAKIDSVKSWLQQKKKRNVVVRNKMPVYIRYISCEGQNGNIIFYDDPYQEDKELAEKYFASK